MLIIHQLQPAQGILSNLLENYLVICGYWGQSFPQVSCVSVYLIGEALTAACSKHICMTFNNSRWQQCFSVEKSSGIFTPIIQDLSSLNSCFLLCNTLYCRHHLTHFTLPCGFWALRSGKKKLLILWLLILLFVINYALFLIQKSHVFHQHP